MNFKLHTLLIFENINALHLKILMLYIFIILFFTFILFPKTFDAIFNI